MTKYCKCGCGTEIADDNTWVKGHHRKGKPHTSESKQKISDAKKGILSPLKGRTLSAETCKNMSDANKGKPSPLKGRTLTEAHKQKLSGANKGKKASDETKKKMSDVRKGKPRTAETKKKISDAHKGITHTDETRKKISDVNKGKIPTAETCKRISDGLKGRPVSEETRRRLSATHQGLQYDEWESFACESLYCPKFTEACKESNREKYGRKCFICGKSEKDNGQKLSVHHVDMDKAQGCDSNWKLVPLCKRHHATSHNDEIISRLGYLLDETKCEVVHLEIPGSTPGGAHAAMT